MNTAFRAVLSPCIGVCTLDDDGLCEGCLRTTSEIARWSQMNDDERLRLMEHVLPATQAVPLGFLDPFTTISGFRVVPVVAVIDPSFVPQPEPNEVADVFEVPLDYLLAPDSLRRVEVDYRGRRRVVLEYGWPGQRIWGATAAILFNLRERLERSA